jgi:hypothetical protein
MKKFRSKKVILSAMLFAAPILPSFISAPAASAAPCGIGGGTAETYSSLGAVAINHNISNNFCWDGSKVTFAGNPAYSPALTFYGGALNITMSDKEQNGSGVGQYLYSMYGSVSVKNCMWGTNTCVTWGTKGVRTNLSGAGNGWTTGL